MPPEVSSGTPNRRSPSLKPTGRGYSDGTRSQGKNKTSCLEMKRDLTDKSVENRPASRILLENKFGFRTSRKHRWSWRQIRRLSKCFLLTKWPSRSWKNTYLIKQFFKNSKDKYTEVHIIQYWSCTFSEVHCFSHKEVGQANTPKG